jgi:hypothetical protein
MSDNDKKSAARAAYQEGADLQEKGKYAEALADFEKAEKLYDAPTHLLHMAQCQAQLGHLVEASENYETLAHKTLEKGAPDAFKQAQEQGAKELEALKPRIPTLRVNVKPDPKDLPNLQINLNDKQMPVEMVGIARPINPGSYKVTASATGYGTKEATTITIAEKDAKSVDLTLEKGVSVPGATPATGTDTVVKPKPEPTEGPTATGLLLGVRPTAFVPFGRVDSQTKFKEYAGAGVGAGIDVIGRVAQHVLVGGTLEAELMGGPERYSPSDPSVLPAAVRAEGGIKADISVVSEYIGLLVGYSVNNDKVSPVAFVRGGYRYIQRSVTLNVANIKADDNVNGIEAGLHAGVSIPAGPLRLVPLLNFDGGQFSTRDCVDASKLGGTGPTPGSVGATCTSPDGGLFFMIGLSAGLYFNLDFGPAKGSGSAAKIKNLTQVAF